MNILGISAYYHDSAACLVQDGRIVAAARDAGKIADLHEHFVEQGYFEGRFGAEPRIDEEYYLQTNPDVRQAITSGTVKSALEHYLRSGAAEGRIPNPDFVDTIKCWRDAFQ